MSKFVHLHVHSEYSLLDGACPIGKLLDRVAELGMDACAITDHGVMYGVVDFYNEALQRGIRPIIGCEVYVCRDMEEKSLREAAHLVLLCENQTGYQNLMKIVSEAFVRGYYYKPRVDYSYLAEHSQGLIALSACLSGDIPSLLLDGRYNSAVEMAEKYRDIFGEDNFFIEIQDHGIPEQKQILPDLIKLARQTNCKLVATNDVHYISREDFEAQDILMCIQTNKTVDDPDRLRMNTQELFLKSYDEMHELFSNIPEALENTVEIAARCNVEFDFNTIHLPEFHLPEGRKSDEYLRELCYDGAARKYDMEDEEVAQSVRNRLDYELTTINDMGYNDYFLIVWDFMRYARERGIVVGPGRGSGAGSIVAHTLSITAIDPLKYNLLFERFLNPERITMPDIDIDFCYERRQEVIDYVARQYGADHVAQIITFGTMKARLVLRDVGRALGMPYASVDYIAKLVPFALDMTLDKALQQSREFANVYQNDPDAHRLINISKKLEGMPRHASTHAAGVLITGKPAYEYVPLQRNDDVITTQFPMNTLESLGLLKMDFLGLRTLTVIRDTLEMLKDIGVELKNEDIPLDDAETYDMISRGETDGVFQLEGGGMRTFLTNMKPENFEDIIAAISLYRPGPMDSIPRYIQGKHDKTKITYDHPLLEPILSVTYGCIVYQEQVMQIVRELGGYSLGRSDLVRRAMSKKKHDVMDKEREYFVHGKLAEDGSIEVPGAVRRGVPVEVAEKIFDDMSAFASYAFNKSHAAAYGVVAIQTGYLKCHYPVQFIAALMNSYTGNSVKIAGYIQYCRTHSIGILPPDVNNSLRKFSVEGNAIRFGLGHIKNAGQAAVEAIVQERLENGEYKNIFDFADRVRQELVSKRVVESLIKAGAFDSTGMKRSQLMFVFERAMDAAAQQKRDMLSGQTSMFDLGLAAAPPPVPDLPEHPPREMLLMEKEITGVYITGHPLQAYMDVLENIDTSTQWLAGLADDPELAMQYDNTTVRMGGVIVEVKNKATKSGNMMAFVTLEDLTGQIELIIFPKVYEKYKDILTLDQTIMARGRLSMREEEDTKLLPDYIVTLDQLRMQPQLLNQMPAKNGRQGNGQHSGGYLQGNANGNGSYDIPQYEYYNPDEIQVQPVKKEDLACEKPVKLYLRLREAQIPMVNAILTNHPGGMATVFCNEETRKAKQAPRDMWIHACEESIGKLKKLLGGENVRIK